jgi:hypothetical protein
LPDDPSISDETPLYRRLHPQLHVQWDENRQCRRFTSGAFQNTTGTLEMSVVLGDTLEVLGREPETVLADRPDWYLVSLLAGRARAHDQGIVRDPLDSEPAHGNVVGEKPTPRKRALAREAEWVIGPEDACLEERR